MENQNSQIRDFQTSWKKIMSGTVTAILCILMVIYPLYMDNAYFNILESKYKAFYIPALVLIALLLLELIVAIILDQLRFQGECRKNYFKNINFKNWLKTTLVVDVFVILFFIACVCSTLKSNYLYESFWGNEGRYSGLFLIMLYVFVFLIIAHVWEFKAWMIQLCLFSGLIINVLGITEYFYLDVFGFHVGMQPEQIPLYVSTLGNINTYTAYVALTMGVSTGLFAIEENWKKCTWYYINMVVSFAALIVGRSDNGYLSLGILFVVLPMILFSKKQGILRYLLAGTSLITVIQVFAVINRVWYDRVIGITGIFDTIGDLSVLPVIVILLWALVGGCWYWFEKKNHEFPISKKVLVGSWIALVALGVIGLVFMWYDTNTLGNGARYGGLQAYLEYNDDWGSGRGFIWTRSMTIFNDFSFKRKFFGYGPDTFGVLMVQLIMRDMLQVSKVIYDNAHNEYLHYLLTIGMFGTGTYICFLLATFQSMFKVAANHGVVFGCLLAGICYATQAVVNLNLPVVTPMFWLLLAVGIAGYKKYSNET